MNQTHPDDPNEVVGSRPQVAAWCGAAMIVALLALVGVKVIEAPGMEWDVVGDYLFSREILAGMLVTIELTIVAMLVGVVGGTILALMRSSRASALRWISSTFVWAFRSVPLLVQLLLWFNLGLVLPRLSITLPGLGELIGASTNDLITPFLAAVLGLGLHEAAYTAEIVRSGLEAIPKGQHDAAKMLSLTPRQVTRFVILPQAVRMVIPPLGNQLIGMLKTTSLVSVIGGAEMLTRAENIYAVTYQVVPLLIVVSFWYAVLTTICSIVQSRIERAMSRDRTTASTPTPLTQLDMEQA